MKNKKMVKNRLGYFIFRHYSKSALYPILIIELLLLLLYFGINYYNTLKTQNSLRAEVQVVIPHLVRQQANKINLDFELISNETQFFANAHKDFFENIGKVNIIGEHPVFEKASNGTLYQSNIENGSSLWYPRTDLNDRQREYITKTVTLNPLYEHVVKDVPNVVASYLNTPDEMNRLYPFIPNVSEQYPVSLNMEDYNFYYLADARHNPGRKPVWTGVYLDPAGQGWMLSCVAPVYNADTLTGVVGLDVTTQKIVDNVLKMDLPWSASAFLTDSAGMILAMSPQVEDLFNLKELKSHVYNSTISKEQLKPENYNLLKSKDVSLVNQFKKAFAVQDTITELEYEEHKVFIVQKVIPETGWRLFVVVPEEKLFASADEVANISRIIGAVAILVMVLFYLIFFFLLRNRANNMAKNISQPITAVSEAVVHIGDENNKVDLPMCGIEEIDSLTETFNTMSKELDERNKQLIEKRVQIEVQEKEAQLAYAQGMFESASGYLHNVGNSITALNSNLIDLNEVVKSTEQYSAVFAKLKEQNDAELLAKFEDVLLNKTVPRLHESVNKISIIRETIQQTIQHQQQSFKDSKSVMTPVNFNLSEMISQICADLKPASELIEIQINIEPGVNITHHKNQLHQGLTNVIKNSIEALDGKGLIKVSMSVLDGKIQIKVVDNGVGISTENLPKMLTPGFTSKKTGHGLGLHSFSVFLSANNGVIKVESEGSGKGATITVDLKIS